ncbi:MAG: DUF1294 domain-containing protein [Clostridia bacterium]|nr:DUF1294 domain-containing protein [Clostridia bacterium]
MQGVIFGFAVMSLVAFLLTVYDKASAKAGGRRVPERTLLLVAALGGALVEWLTMRLIRHKTKHPKFMIGLPLLIVLHAVLVGAAWLIWMF